MEIRGRSLAELELGRRSGAMVLAIRENGKLIANPGGDTQMAPGQLLIVLGSKTRHGFNRVDGLPKQRLKSGELGFASQHDCLLYTSPSPRD